MLRLPPGWNRPKQADHFKGIGSDEWIVREILLRRGGGEQQEGSSKQVYLARYSLADDNDTVTDHKTGLIWQRLMMD